MSESTPIEALAHRLFMTLPESLQNLEQDIQQKFKQILSTAFSTMNLVTREEFDVQTKVLARTREKIEQLEARL